MQRRGHRKFLALVVWFALGELACDSSRQHSVQRQTAHSGQSHGPAQASIIELKSSGPLETPYFQRPIWQRAARNDPMDLFALANRVDAQTLLDVALQGGRAGSVALRALAHSPAGYFLLHALCEHLPRLEPAEDGLAAIEKILDRSKAAPQELAEVVSATARCRASLSGLLNAPLGRVRQASLDPQRINDLRRQLSQP